jgi:short-subunit dehydrogenase
MRILAGQVILLTGASGGLGTYMAQAFAERKVKLALVAHPGIDLEGLRKSVADSSAEAIAITSDLREPDRRREMLATVRSRLGPIDILVNNAGVEYTSFYHELKEEQIGEVLSVNLEAPMILSRLVLPEMLGRKQGHLVNISSLAGKSGPASGVVCGDQSGLGGLYAVTAGHLPGHWGERVGDRSGFRGSWDLCAAQGEDGPAGTP